MDKEYYAVTKKNKEIKFYSLPQLAKYISKLKGEKQEELIHSLLFDDDFFLWLKTLDPANEGKLQMWKDMISKINMKDREIENNLQSIEVNLLKLVRDTDFEEETFVQTDVDQVNEKHKIKQIEKIQNKASFLDESFEEITFDEEDIENEKESEIEDNNDIDYGDELKNE